MYSRAKCEIYTMFLKAKYPNTQTQFSYTTPDCSNLLLMLCGAANEKESSVDNHLKIVVPKFWMQCKIKSGLCGTSHGEDK